MITRQLKALCTLKNCFLFEGRVYEKLVNHKHAFRVILSDDDYDYVTDRNLRRRLNKFLTNNKEI